MPSGTRWGPWRSLLALSPILIGGPWLAYNQHFKLPEPLSALTNPITNLPQISEEQILGVSRHLSEEIGYRTVGTYEHALADKWMVEAAEKVKRNCERVVRETGRKLECEVWRQEGSGNHRFDMMGKRLYKTYVNLSNIVVRISDGTPEGKEHAVLVNAHLDSTLPSPGAADDALSVGVMLDCMRVLVDTPNWTPRHAVIFLFNHAEESLQDGSHLFSTQHPIASTVRAMVNLEAAGTSGREILFQATSQEMISAYSRVPRPYGTIFANEIFSSGIILSDTDFRQFELYLNVTGLDMAVVGNSYLYHMRKDIVENIEAGVAQHMGENALALIRHLTSESSPLPSLTEGYSRPTTVFFTHIFHSFFLYSYSTAKVMYSTLLVVSFAFVRAAFVDPSPALKKSSQNGMTVFWQEQVKGARAVGAGVAGTILTPIVVAVLMKHGLGKAMSWFSSPLAPIGLYGPAALLGALLSQYLIGEVHEESVYSSILLLQGSLAVGVQMAGIGSAAIFFLTTLPLFISLLFNSLLVKMPQQASKPAGQTSVKTKANGKVNGNGAVNGVSNGVIVGGPEQRRVSLWTYAIGQGFPLITGTMLLLGILDFFVPLTGRIGGQAPADIIIATIISSLGAMTLPLALPFSHRFGRKALRNGVLVMTAVTGIAIAVFAMRAPFDSMHQKRVFILRLENVTTHEHHLHIAAADGAPGFENLVRDIVNEFAAPETDTVHALSPVVMDDSNSDWDQLYPFSAFLTTYKVPLAVHPSYISPWAQKDGFKVVAIDHGESRLHGSGSRNVTIRVDHPGLIWTVIAFDAHVLHWSLDDSPPNEHTRHHVKEGSFYGQDSYSFDMIIKTPTLPNRLRVNFVGMQEKGVWPAKKSSKAQGGIAMELFEKMDAWIDEKTGGAVDTLLVGSVAGVMDV
ncbi:hypothetical protein CPB83DRAFT_861305 [Crepidotus variabilis]|uniref:Peptide hydrolase n=1 Tax=Crepidotus variabilis TaxID=179855 RepID=A0A9P6JKM5_9AGAR|nr:hypothetical protein CPB83DRAFT_861305 [Crepidotus variabilis]